MTRTRIAPSPTGSLHVGTARAALYNWLWARKMNGQFVLRIEDTDKERSKKDFEKDIISSLEWLGLSWDEMYRQSDRFETYTKKAEELVQEGKAYKEGDAIILKKTLDKIYFDDLIRGKIEFDLSAAKDPVIIKSDGSPTYNFAVVVDDSEMGITDVIRGEDHIPNTPIHLQIAESLEVEPPKYAHLPLVLAPDRSKLSKRHGAVSVNEYKKEGYLPEALINFMVLLGWNPGDDREIFTKEELVKDFSLDRVHKGGAAFNVEKLNWINQQHIQKMPPEKLKEILEEFTKKEISESLVSIARPRITTLKDIEEDLQLLEEPEYSASILPWKNSTLEATIKNLEAAKEIVKNIDEENFNKESLEEGLMPYANQEGRGDVLWPFRVALSGKENSPGPFELAELLGKEETIKRIGKAIEKIN